MPDSFDATLNIATQLTQRVGLNVAATYNPVMRDSFYALVPAEFKFYYTNVVRRCLNWYHGYVPEVHAPSVGIPSTNIGTMIVKEVTKLIYGGEVFFENKYAEKTNKKSTLDGGLAPINDTLKRFNQWSDKYNFQTTIKQFIEYGAAGGSSALVTYVNEDRELFSLPYRIDQFFYTVSASGRVTSYTGFIKVYTAESSAGENRQERSVNFYYLEERFFKDSKPYVKFSVKRSNGNVTSGQNFDIRSTDDLQWEQLPKKIQQTLKRDFPGMKFGVEIPIEHTKNLGVYIFNYTAVNRIPEVKMGESVLLNVIAYLIEYEFENACMWSDLYNSRGKVLVPAEMRNSTESATSYYQGFDADIFTKAPYTNPQDQKPIPIQFEFRADDHAKSRNNTTEKIAATIGVSGSDVFSFLRDVSGGSKTATQIAAESQKTVSYIYEKRALIKAALNEFVREWKDYYKQKDEITIRFSSQNMVNKLVTLEESRVKKEIGYSKFDLFKEQNPDKDDDQINEMVMRSWNEEQKRLTMQAEANMHSFMNANGNPQGDGINEKDETPESGEKQ